MLDKNESPERAWVQFSPFTVRHDEVGNCAELNGGTENCKPGNCELCAHCSWSPQNNKGEN